MATSAALLALAGTARGQDAAAPAASPASSPEATTLAPVRVKAKAEQETATSAVPGYTARCSATATQTDTPLIETGQSISVITRERMDAIGATTATPSSVGAVPTTCATSPTRTTSAIAVRPTATTARPAR
jgi:iron complex outermembrane receptor protein